MATMEFDYPNLFQGIRFHLAGFDPQMHDQVKLKIVSCGGVYVAENSSDCTHVIVYNLLLDDPICVAARRDGTALVTSTWIDHSLIAGKPANTSSIIYRPAKELNGIPGAKKLVICMSGYQGYLREYIRTMVSLTGAQFSGALIPTSVTHLICYKFEGQKYVSSSKRPKIKLVNHRWLEDCLKQWKILPEENYSKSSFELETMEAVAEDSEDETADITTRLTHQMLMNGRVYEARLPLKPEQVMESKVLHKIDTHSLIQPNNDEQNVGKTPAKFSSPLHVGEKSGNLSGQRPKRSADSLTDYCTPSNLRKFARTSNVSDGKSVGSQVKPKGYLESNDVGASNLKEDEVIVGSTSVGGLKSKRLSGVHVGNYSPDVEGQCVLPHLKQFSGHLDVPHVATDSRVLIGTANKSLDAPEPETPVSGPLKRSKKSSLTISSCTSSQTVRASEDKLVNDVPCESLTLEKLEVGISGMGTRTSPIIGNVVSCALPGVDKMMSKPQIIQENVPFSPELKKLESSKSGNAKLNTDDQTGSLTSKPPRKKMAARKKMGSRSKVSQKTTDAHKGSLSVNFSKDDAVLHLTSHTEGKDNANSFVVDNDMAPRTDESSTVKFKPLMNSTAQINDYANPVNEETYEKAEMTTPFVANLYKEHENQHLAQEKVISGQAKEKQKTVIRAPKEVLHDADVDVGKKVREEKESANGKTLTAAGKKRRGDQLVKGPVQVESAIDKGDHDKGDHVDDKLRKKLPGTFKVLREGENEGDPCANNQCTMKDLKHTGKKKPGTMRLSKLASLISAEKENMSVAHGKSGNLSGKLNDSIVANHQGAVKGKKIDGKKRCGTLMLNKADKENEFLFHEDEKSNGALPKSIPPVRENNANSSESLTIQSGLTAVKSKQACFIVSGHKLQRKEFQLLIKRLKGKHCRDSHQWSYQATHFIVPDPIRRTEKFFAAAASGRWILKADYLTESITAGEFLPEEPYEWHINGLSQDGAINLEAPRKWRLLREKTGHGAFYGMRIVVYGECIAPTLDTLKRVVKAGEGTILATSPPYTRLLNSGVDFAIISQGMPRVDVWVQEFLRHEIPCVSVDYLVEYVCKPGYPLDRHVLYNTHEWAAKSFARLSSLSIQSATPKN
ncbi:BRCT domain-containing protein At4g02110-like [Silene latifolia]|uniref:BRCT domain-containing protein At4g02110-like n=1 Tax=Silene latifolia TaxID=37657 RepID=UPI003D77F0D6